MEVRERLWSDVQAELGGGLKARASESLKVVLDDFFTQPTVEAGGALPEADLQAAFVAVTC